MHIIASFQLYRDAHVACAWCDGNFRVWRCVFRYGVANNYRRELYFRIPLRDYISTHFRAHYEENDENPRFYSAE